MSLKVASTAVRDRGITQEPDRLPGIAGFLQRAANENRDAEQASFRRGDVRTGLLAYPALMNEAQRILGGLRAYHRPPARK